MSKSVKYGSSKSQYDKAERFLFDDVTTNDSKAVEILIDLANQGYPKASFQLYWAYSNGVGRPKILISLSTIL